MFTIEKSAYQDSKINVLIDNESGAVWFDARHVCDVLGFSKKDIVSKLDKEDHCIVYKSLLIGCNGRIWDGDEARVFISEPGLYDLTVFSKNADAKQFRSCLTHKILPAFRKAWQEKEQIRNFLARVISPSLLAWQKTFPDEFYIEMFRLLNWNWAEWRVKKAKPSYAGFFVAKYVYDPLCPGLLESLREKNQRQKNSKYGLRVNKHHQWLTKDIGKPQLQNQERIIFALMKVSSDQKDFDKKFRKVFPRSENTTNLFLQTQANHQRFISNQLVFDFEGENV